MALLKIPYDSTIAFQSQQITLSDVYGRWIGMQQHLNYCKSKKQFVSNLADHLVAALEKRSKTIFDNPFMSCALYLDPRYHRVIVSNEEKLEEAKETLLKIHQRIQANKPTQNIVSAAEKSNDSHEFSFEFSYDHNDATVSQTDATTDETIAQTNDIEILIEIFQPEPFSAQNMSILQYWESIKDTHHELYEIAMVVFAVPPTEVQIERDFSALKNIFTNCRYNLQQARLESILLIHLNKDLFYKVNELQISVLMESNKN